MLILRATSSGTEYGLILRADMNDDVQLNLIGGRTRFQETIASSVVRHVQESLGAAVQVSRFNPHVPVSVSEYLRQPAEHGGPFDPRKHQISLNFVVGVRGQPELGGEALGLRWFDLGEDPGGGIGFGQQSVIASLVEWVREDSRAERITTDF